MKPMALQSEGAGNSSGKEPTPPEWADFESMAEYREWCEKNLPDKSGRGTQPDPRGAARMLWERNRLCCGWYVRSDFTPETDEEILFCLRLLARHGDRGTYIEARRMMKCL